MESLFDSHDEQFDSCIGLTLDDLLFQLPFDDMQYQGIKIGAWQPQNIAPNNLISATPSIIYDWVSKLQFNDIQYPEIPIRDWQSQNFALNSLIRPTHPIIKRSESLRKRSRLIQIEAFPLYNQMDEETLKFVKQSGLTESIFWLEIVAPKFFEGAEFEIYLLPGEEGDIDMLVLRVHGSLSASEFREKRYLLCDAMLDAGHKKLFEILSIFQRRIPENARQAISRYSYAIAA